MPNYVKPLLRYIASRAVASEMVGGQFAPHRKTHDVGVVQKPLVLHFLMFAHAVKAHGFAQFYIFYERVLARRRYSALLPVALVEQQPRIKRRVVQKQLAVFCRKFPKPEITARFVAFLSVAQYGDIRVVKHGAVGIPQLHLIGEICAVQPHANAVFDIFRARAHRFHVLAVERDIKAHARRRRGHRHAEIEFNRIVFYRRGDFAVSKIQIRNVLEPHRFVYARGLHVPAPEILVFPTLFAAHLHRMVGVRTANRKHVLVLGEIVRNIERKPFVRAFMLARKHSVYVNTRLIVRALEMQQRAFALFARNGARVPHAIMRSRVGNAAEFCFVTERHANFKRQFAAKRVALFHAFSETEFPFAVQVLPIRTNELRTGIFRNITLCMLHNYSSSFISIYSLSERFPSCPSLRIRRFARS